MYSTLLTLHSFIRWLVLISLVLATYRAWRGWRDNKPFSRVDHGLRIGATSVVHTQFVLGVWLYFISPIVDYFLHHFTEAVHMREIRFFGMEHITMMLIAVTLITMGSSLSKRKATDKDKFKTMAIWFAIGLFIIFVSIPWKFSPFTSRPYLRTF